MSRLNASFWVVILLIVVSAFRLWYCTTLDLVPDEAQYWLWSKHLDASYFSKGPAVAWTIAFGTWLGGDSVLGIRWLSILLSAGTGWQLFLLGRRLYSPQVGLAVVVVAAITPLFAVGSVLMTIDPLSVFFWTWAANLFWNSLHEDRLWQWCLCGFAVGCGFLAKYTNAMELISFLLFLLFVPRWRAQLWTRFPLLLGVVAFCALPVLWWNAHHGWVTVRHVQEGGHLDQPFQLNLTQFIRFWENQALVISPLIFCGILLAIALKSRDPQKNEAERFLLFLFLPVFLLYTILSLNEAANANWTAPSFIGGLLVASAFWMHRASVSRGAKAFVLVALTVGLIETALMHESYWLNLKKDPALKLRGWSHLGPAIQPYLDHYQPNSLIAEDYGLASELAFYTPSRPTTFIPETGRIENQFSLWPSYPTGEGQSCLYVTGQPEGLLPGKLKSEFSHQEKVGEILRFYRKRTIETYQVWLLQN